MDRRERERERSRQSSSNDRVDLDSRTPLAWQHRDFNYQHSANSQSNFHERYPGIVFSFPNNNNRTKNQCHDTHKVQTKNRFAPLLPQLFLVIDLRQR